MQSKCAFLPDHDRLRRTRIQCIQHFLRGKSVQRGKGVKQIFGLFGIHRNCQRLLPWLDQQPMMCIALRGYQFYTDQSFNRDRPTTIGAKIGNLPFIDMHHPGPASPNAKPCPLPASNQPSRANRCNQPAKTGDQSE